MEKSEVWDVWCKAHVRYRMCFASECTKEEALVLIKNGIWEDIIDEEMSHIEEVISIE